MGWGGGWGVRLIRIGNERNLRGQHTAAGASTGTCLTKWQKRPPFVLWTAEQRLLCGGWMLMKAPPLQMTNHAHHMNVAMRLNCSSLRNRRRLWISSRRPLPTMVLLSQSQAPVDIAAASEHLSAPPPPPPPSPPPSYSKSSSSSFRTSKAAPRRRCALRAGYRPTG